MASINRLACKWVAGCGMTRKRAHINLTTKLACALAELLPENTRNSLRESKVAPEVIIRLFEWDHVILKTWDGADEWWNLTPLPVAVHREKTKKDQGKIAKVRNFGKPSRYKQQGGTWPKQKMTSRGFLSRDERRALKEKYGR